MSFVLSSEYYVYRVDEDDCATAANQMRHSSVKDTAKSLGDMDAANAVHSTDNTGGFVTAPERQRVDIGCLNDNEEKEVVCSPSVKIDSSFVADTLAVDIVHSRKSDVSALNQSRSEMRMQIKSENADNADVREREQTSELNNVTAVISSCLTSGSNMVSILITMFIVVTFHLVYIIMQYWKLHLESNLLHSQVSFCLSSAIHGIAQI